MSFRLIQDPFPSSIDQLKIQRRTCRRESWMDQRSEFQNDFSFESKLMKIRIERWLASPSTRPVIWTTSTRFSRTAPSYASLLTPSNRELSRRSTRARWRSSAWRTSQLSWMPRRLLACQSRRPSSRSTCGNAKTWTRWSSACSLWDEKWVKLLANLFLLANVRISRPTISASHRLAPRKPTRTSEISPRNSLRPDRTSSRFNTDQTKAPTNPESTSATLVTCKVQQHLNINNHSDHNEEIIPRILRLSAARRDPLLLVDVN